MSVRPLVIGVAGGSGSGKTTVARAILDASGIRATFLDQDAYYKDLARRPLDERRRVNFDHPDAFDHDLMVDHLTQLAAGRAIDKPVYDYARHARAEATVRVEPCAVVVVEGILVFVDPRLRELCDIKIYVDVPDDLRFIRRLERDVSERGRAVSDVVAQYLATVRPMHLEFVEPSKRWADVILPEGGRNHVGLEVLVAHIRWELQRRVG